MSLGEQRKDFLGREIMSLSGLGREDPY
jgi:hypothetical protein